MSAVQRIDDKAAQRAWGDVTAPLGEAFRLESDETLTAPHIRLRFFGDRSAPPIVVAGGISAGRNVADADGEDGWWRDFVFPGGAVDLRRHCVIGFDFLPNEHEVARTITTVDQARALARALDDAGVETLFGFVGASYGAMVAMAFASLFPARIQNLVAISAADRPHPFGAALRGVQRRIVKFAADHGDARAGVSLARQLAMASYRTPQEFAARFSVTPGRAAGDASDVCDYLIARGQAFALSAERFVTLSDSIDRHCVDLSKITARTLFVAAQGDQLCPPGDVRRCAGAVHGARYVEIVSQYGHDAFLKEAASLGPFIQRFLEESSS